MEYPTIRGKEYGFVSGYGKDDTLRSSFNALTQKVYGFDFEQWYQNGYWKNQYIPYSLLYKDKIVSNVSVNILDFNVLGEPKRYIQLGTVMTDPDFRIQGLSRFLIEKAIHDYQDKCDLLYLFANDSVLEFYPKFGFEKAEQVRFIKKPAASHPRHSMKNLDMSNSNDREFVLEKVNHAVPVSPLSMCGNAELILFYTTLFMTDSVYYIEEYDTVVIADFREDTIEIFDIFSPKPLQLDDIINSLANKNTNEIRLGFTPFDTSSYTMLPLGDNDTLFAMGRDLPLIKGVQFMFPILSHT